MLLCNISIFYIRFISQNIYFICNNNNTINCNFIELNQSHSEVLKHIINNNHIESKRNVFPQSFTGKQFLSWNHNNEIFSTIFPRIHLPILCTFFQAFLVTCVWRQRTQRRQQKDRPISQLPIKLFFPPTLVSSRFSLPFSQSPRLVCAREILINSTIPDSADRNALFRITIIRSLLGIVRELSSLYSE